MNRVARVNGFATFAPDDLLKQRLFVGKSGVATEKDQAGDEER
jgi:hypothetical protein